ncbi:MAG: helix-turn-helix domain-containing protein [Treponema sp.]|jgi:transposase|nr:helix-turn-helix domain-containing protein [Treponema sp.]
MQIQRAFKAHIYPTDEQRVFLNKTFGCCCLPHNKTLNERAINLQRLGVSIPVRRGECGLTSEMPVDMRATALGNNL